MIYDDFEQPRRTSALRQLVIACLMAAIALVVAVLPAEYGIDPTGLGARTGLLVLATTTATSASEPIESSSATERHFQITLAPGMGQEFKLIMPANAALSYQWQTQGGAVFVDMHGEPEGDTSGYFLSYAETTTSAMQGTLISRFDGHHGWYWENRSPEMITIELLLEGDYPLLEK